jgi:ferric-dicitrate binding protein FerR (iron transport regulator)
MRNRPLTTLLLAGAIAWAGAALAPVVAGAAKSATVTAVVGSAQRGGHQALEHLAGVGEDEPVATSQDGGCSLLLEENAVVELCGDTRLSLRRPTPGGPRVLEIERGRVRISAEKRLGDERIEIHTPAVIATILGTVVFVSVDVLGVTTITSEVSKVMVASSNPALSQATILEGGEQLVVSPGEPPPVAPKRLDATALSELGGCLVDFHDASLQADRKEMLRREAEMISEADAMTADLPVVGLVEPPADQAPDDPGEIDDPTGGPDVYPPTSVNPLVGPPDDGYPEPCQDGFPGDHCGPSSRRTTPGSLHALFPVPSTPENTKFAHSSGRRTPRRCSLSIWASCARRRASAPRKASAAAPGAASDS